MPIPEANESEKAAETVIVQPEAQVEHEESAEEDQVADKVDKEDEAVKAPEPIQVQPEAKNTNDEKKDNDDDAELEGGEEDTQLPLISESENTVRLIFRNVAKGSALSDQTLKQLSFIYVDLSLQFFKVNDLSDDDAELLKQLEQEKANLNTDDAKAERAKANKTTVDSQLPVEVRAVKLFKQISADDPRLHNLSAKQGVNLLKTDKTLRSQIVLKIREQLDDDIPAD